jgi:hypothetical protein
MAGFSVLPLKISCESVLSTNSSPWGARDGIRLYCLLTTSGNFRQLLVSGRQFPPPDLVDNYLFTPGAELDLSSFPPHGRTNWESGEIELGSSDFLSIVLIGLNEGLPYIAGGGGFGGPGQRGFYEAQKSLAGKLADAASKAVEGTAGALTDGIFEALKTLLEELNSYSDCRGVAFAHSVVLNRKTLLFETLHGPFVLKPLIDEVGIASSLLIKQGCGRPRYSVPASIRRTFTTTLTASTTITSTVQGADSVPVTASTAIAACKPQGPMLQWVSLMDRSTSITSSSWFSECSPTWTINGVTVPLESGTLTVPVNATSYVRSGSKFTQQESPREITIDYQQPEDIGGARRLVLDTKGSDGAFTLTIGLHYNFEGTYDHSRPQGEIEIATTQVWIAGQTLAGNEAYEAYEDCVRAVWSSIIQLGQRLVQLEHQLGPISPGPLDLGDLEQRIHAVSDHIRAIGKTA